MVILITYRAARTGIITGILLAVARISGETAPLLCTSLNNQFWSSNMNAPLSNLPVVIFQFAMSPYEDWQRLAWGGAALITIAVLVLNIVARTLFRKGTLWAPGYSSPKQVADNEVHHYVDTLTNPDVFLFEYNKGELQYNYLLFENGGNPTVLGPTPRSPTNLAVQ